MIVYKIIAGDGTQGYQVMDNNRYFLGLYNLDGTPFTGTGGFSTLDNGGDPTVGCKLPIWSASVPAPPSQCTCSLSLTEAQINTGVNLGVSAIGVTPVNAG